MTLIHTTIKLLLALLFTFLGAPQAQAHEGDGEIPRHYTNHNIMNTTHDMPIFLRQNDTGEFYGRTVTGKEFRQVNVCNRLGVRLQRFEIDRAYWYVSDRGVIKAPNDLVALSRYIHLG